MTTTTNNTTPSATTTSARTEALLAAVAFDASNLVPVIAQDIRSGGVRMFAWADREAVRLTAETGQAHFWSRSRQALWRKGESSGNVLHVRDIRIDCDGDVILYLVNAEGPSCHTGHTSCFFRSVGALTGPGASRTNGEASADASAQSSVRVKRAAEADPPPAQPGSSSQPAQLLEDDGPGDPPALILERLAQTITRRRRERPEKSYVVSLLDGGWPTILGKITEEAGELAEALPAADAAHTAHEAADLLFHMLVGLEKAGVALDELFAELYRRFGVSGLQEKANRGQATARGNGAAAGAVERAVDDAEARSRK